MSDHGICGMNNPHCDKENPHCDYYEGGLTEEEEVEKAYQEWKNSRLSVD